MNILFETDKLKVVHEYEWTALIDKVSGRIVFEDDFYGDPDCALIDVNNAWAIVGGEHLTIWRKGIWRKWIWRKEQLIYPENPELTWIHSLRLTEPDVVEILTDPWSEHSAIWQLDMRTLKARKLRDFTVYKDKPYTDKIEW